MQTRKTTLGRATPAKVKSFISRMPSIVRSTYTDVVGAITPSIHKTITPFQWWWIAIANMLSSEASLLAQMRQSGAIRGHLQAAIDASASTKKFWKGWWDVRGMAGTILQMIRSYNPAYTDAYMRRAGEAAYRFALSRTIGNQKSNTEFAEIALDHLITQNPVVLHAFIQKVFSNNPATAGKTGQKETELVGGQPCNDPLGKMPKGEGSVPAPNRESTRYNPEQKESLPLSIPRIKSRPLDSGKWNLLGDAIVESARATRRAYRRSDCDSGMLDSRKFSEVGVGINLDRAFIQTRPARSRRLAVEILIDVSSSTQGMVNNTEASMAKAITEAFNKAQVACRIYAFNADCHVAKDYHHKQVEWETLGSGGGTEMGSAMSVSRKSLLGRQADRKIMLILSDGDSGAGSAEQATLARQNRMEVYGFFIGVDVPSEVRRSFTGAFGNLTPTACVNEVCGAVRRSLAENQNR